jgi:hypothetical protein
VQFRCKGWKQWTFSPPKVAALDSFNITQYPRGIGHDRFANNPIDRVSPIVLGWVLPSVANKNRAAPENGVWHYLEIGYLYGLSSVWLEGEEWLTYLDPSPLGARGISLSARQNMRELATSRTFYL